MSNVMTEEQFEFLKERLHFGHYDNSQEASNYRAITSHPVFCVQEVHRVYGVDPDITYEGVRQHYLYDEECYDSIEDINYAHDGDVDLDDIEEIYSAITWQDINHHLTLEAAQRYIEENRHNLSGPRVYIKSMNRCHELIGLVNAIINGDIVYKNKEGK